LTIHNDFEFNENIGFFPYLVDILMIMISNSKVEEKDNILEVKIPATGENFFSVLLSENRRGMCMKMFCDGFMVADSICEHSFFSS
jgi:hypothetical protein